MRKKFSIIIPPIIVIILMGVYYAFKGIYPFGTKLIAWCDMEQQVIPILMQFKDILEGKSSILYSSVNAGGMNFWGVFLFFISSPFSFLVIFIEKSEMMNFMNILVVLKMAVCALTASIYFKSEIKKLGTGFNIILSLMYAFCGFGLMYFQNVVWFDVMYLFPLLMIGLKRALKHNKPLMYIIVLSAFMAVNFYLSYMVVIFLIIEVYLYIKICLQGEKRNHATITFICSSFVSMLITAVFWLPAFLQYLNSGRGGSIVGSLSSGGMLSHISDKLELVICTAIIFVIIPILFLKRLRISLNNRATQLTITLILLLIPVLIEPINKMWHTGSYQCFPLRYGYMITLVGLTIIGYVLADNKDTVAKKQRVFYLISIIAVCAYICFVALNYTNITVKMKSYVSSLWTSEQQVYHHLVLFGFALIVFSICIIFLKKGLIKKTFTVVLLFIICLTEIFVNVSVFIGNSATEDVLFNQSMQLHEKISDEGYYRVKTERKYIHANMMGALGYNTLAHYTSLTDRDYIFAMKKLGYSSYWMEVCSNGGTRITDAVLANKYTIGSKSFDSEYAELVYTDDLFNIYRNNLYLPVGIITDTDAKSMAELNFIDRVSIQKDYAEKLLGNSDIVKEYGMSEMINVDYSYSDDRHHIGIKNLENKVSQISHKLHIQGTQELYFDLFDNLSTDVWEEQYNSVSVYVNGKVLESYYPNQLNNGILRLGTFTDEDVIIDIKILKKIDVKSFAVFGVDLDRLNESIQNIKTIDVMHGGNEFYTECNASEEEYLYLAIPYNEGFNITINGEKTNAIRVNDCFMALKLNEGRNEIKIKFYPQGFIIGLCISLLGLAIIILAVILREKLRINLNKLTKYKFTNIITVALFIGIIISVYIFPTIISILALFKE